MSGKSSDRWTFLAGTLNCVLVLPPRALCALGVWWVHKSDLLDRIPTEGANLLCEERVVDSVDLAWRRFDGEGRCRVKIRFYALV